jgi:hypothetical protein
MERTKSISTSFYKAYKAVTYALIGLFILGYFGRFILIIGFANVYISLLFIVIVVIAIKYKWFPEFFKEINKLKDVSYDSENLYIVEDKYEEQIPFHEIKDVEIKSLNGIYQFNFFNKNLYDGYIRCKTSMWYPFNYRKVDSELNRVRSMVRKAHQNYREQIEHNKSLASFN